MEIQSTYSGFPASTAGRFYSLSSGTSTGSIQDSFQKSGGIKGGATESAQDSGLKEIENTIKLLEGMRDISRSLGNNKKAQELTSAIEKKKALLKELKSAPPLPVITDGQKSKIGDYIRGLGPMPLDLNDGVKDKLEHFRSLVVNGMAFSDSSMQELKSEEAFSRLVSKRWHSREDQVQYKTIDGDYMVFSTLRPDYVKPLDHFIKNSKKGFVFYENKDGAYKPLRTAGEFLDVYKDNPEGALVKTLDDRYVTADEAARLMAEREIKGMIPQGMDEMKPQIVEEDDMVIIGGVILRKKAE